MKKSIRMLMISFILGTIIGVSNFYGASNYNGEDIYYDNSRTNKEVNNVQDAIDGIYSELEVKRNGE